MKVLFVATVTEHIKAFHLPYLQWFKSQGAEVHVATYGDDEIPYCDKKHNIAVSRSPFKFRNMKAYLQLKTIMKREKFDIIHGHTPMGGVLARLCGKRHRKHGARIIYTAHGFHFFKGASLINWLLYYPLEKWLARHTDDLITINKEDYTLAQRKMKAKRVHYIPGVGIDIAKFATPTIDHNTMRRQLGIPLDAIVLISVGELNKNKNHYTAIQAFSEIDNSNLYYVICGTGSLETYLRDLCKQLKIDNRVIFVGYRTDTPDLFHMSDIFIFPSLREGLPVAFQEAMAAGLPCIVSKIRGNVDLIEHGKGGFLCNPTNSNEFRTSIKHILQNSGGMGAHNQAAVQQFDIAIVLEQMKEIYGE